jgi:hypothetical protein
MQLIMKLFITVLFCVSLFAAKAQDLIICKNGQQIKSKVIEVDNIKIKYKKFDNPNGPLYTIKKAEVIKIKYKNGTQDVFEKKEEKSTSNNKKEGNEKNKQKTKSTVEPKKVEEPIKKEIKPTSTTKESKSADAKDKKDWCLKISLGKNFFQHVPGAVDYHKTFLEDLINSTIGVDFLQTDHFMYGARFSTYNIGQNSHFKLDDHSSGEISLIASASPSVTYFLQGPNSKLRTYLNVHVGVGLFSVKYGTLKLNQENFFYSADNVINFTSGATIGFLYKTSKKFSFFGAAGFQAYNFCSAGIMYDIK